MPPRSPLAESAGLVLDEMKNLFHSEVRLLRAEVAQNARNLRAGLVLAAVSVVLVLLALGVLLDAGVAALITAGFGAATSGVIVGAAILVVALILAWVARRKLSPGALTPRRSLSALGGHSAVRETGR